MSSFFITQFLHGDFSTSSESNKLRSCWDCRWVNPHTSTILNKGDTIVCHDCILILPAFRRIVISNAREAGQKSSPLMRRIAGRRRRTALFVPMRQASIKSKFRRNLNVSNSLHLLVTFLRGTAKGMRITAILPFLALTKLRHGCRRDRMPSHGNWGGRRSGAGSCKCHGGCSSCLSLSPSFLLGLLSQSFDCSLDCQLLAHVVPKTVVRRGVPSGKESTRGVKTFPSRDHFTSNPWLVSFGSQLVALSIHIGELSKFRIST